MINRHEVVVDRWDFEKDQKFIEDVFELAFGDDAISRGFTREDVLQRLRELSDSALKAVEWTVYDVQEHQPEWGLVECQAWLEANEDNLRERTAEIGGEALADMLRYDDIKEINTNKEISNEQE